MLTQKSFNILREHLKRIQKLLKYKKSSITGILVEGIGQGCYYVSQYKERIKKSLGFMPYPGTLNIKVNKKEIRSFLYSLNKIVIKGFKTKERSFGEITCYKVKIKNLTAAVVVPERTRYDDVLEIIAPFYLRTKFNFKTGDKITISQ